LGPPQTEAHTRPAKDLLRTTSPGRNTVSPTTASSRGRARRGTAPQQMLEARSGQGWGALSPLVLQPWSLSMSDVGGCHRPAVMAQMRSSSPTAVPSGPVWQTPGRHRYQHCASTPRFANPPPRTPLKAACGGNTPVRANAQPQLNPLRHLFPPHGHSMWIGPSGPGRRDAPCYRFQSTHIHSHHDQ
jgi:hypothetical protein